MTTRRPMTAGLVLLSALGLFTVACGTDPPSAPNAEEVSDAPSDGELSRESVGTFQGLAGHDARGSVTFTIRDGVGTLTFSASFSSTPVPDPWVYVNTVEDANQGQPLRVSRLQDASGGQEYSFRIPDGAPGYAYVLVWCDRYNVGVGAATLSP